MCRCLLVWAVVVSCVLSAAVQVLGQAGPGFITNCGQIDQRVAYYAVGPSGAVYLTRQAVVIDLRENWHDRYGPMQRKCLNSGPASSSHSSEVQTGCAVYIRFQGANPAPSLEARGELPGRRNYLIGDDPSGWRTDIPAYKEVVYHDVWPGIDLVYRLEGDVLVYEVVSSAGADTRMVGFAYEGADRLLESSDGSLILETEAGCIREVGPEIGAGKGIFSFAKGAPRTPEGGGPAAPMDDPAALLWSTFLGGNNQESCYAVSLDASDNAVVSGYTWSTNFPATPGAYDTTSSAATMYGDVFIAKISASGDSLLWSTFLGGSDDEEGYWLALDASDNPVVTGFTWSSDFPTTGGACDTSYNDSCDVFVTKLAASGSTLVWSTLIGGGKYDRGDWVAVAESGDILVTGGTASADFPTTAGAYDRTLNGYYDGFVVRLSSSGGALVWSTLLGGSDVDATKALALDSSENPIVAGSTVSSDFPTTAGALDASYNGGVDVFVAKLSAAGSTLLWSTFLGGAGDDNMLSLALDSSENPIVPGWTASSDFPVTAGAYDTSYNGSQDVFVAKLSASGTALVWGTYLGGSGYDRGLALGLEPAGDVCVTGWTGSSDFPTTPGAYDTTYNGAFLYGDAFVAKVSATGDALQWSSFLGAPRDEFGYCLALDSSGDAVVGGYTSSLKFPTTPGAYDASYNGNEDGFVAKIDLSSLAGVIPTRDESSQPVLHSAFPDPFRVSTTLRFWAPQGQHVTVALYDVHGRRVRTFIDTTPEGGMRAIEWDGMTERGAHSAPGIYFIRMEAGAYHAAGKVVLLR
jgi:hypothetical protein